MKVVIHTQYGGFSLSQECFKWLRDNREWKVTTLDKDAEPVDKEAKLYIWPKHLGGDGKNQVEMFEEPYEDESLPFEERYSKKVAKLQSDPDIVAAVEALGDKAGENLKVVDIPDNIEFTIEEYDGIQWVAEKHRTWS